MKIHRTAINATAPTPHCFFTLQRHPKGPNTNVPRHSFQTGYFFKKALFLSCHSRQLRLTVIQTSIADTIEHKGMFSPSCLRLPPWSVMRWVYLGIHIMSVTKLCWCLFELRWRKKPRQEVWGFKKVQCEHRGLRQIYHNKVLKSIT